MRTMYSIEIDKYNPTALTYCLKKLEEGIPNYEYDWNIRVNSGGIDYGIYLNVDIEKNEIEISNQPTYGSDGSDYLDDVLKCFEEEEDM